MTGTSNVLRFNILQWNARSLTANRQELKKFVAEFKDKPDIICVQETWLKPCLDFVVPGYESLREDRQSRSGGGGVVLRLLGQGFSFGGWSWRRASSV